MSKTEVADYLMKVHRVDGSTVDELLDSTRYSKLAAKGSFDKLIEEVNRLRYIKQGCNSIVSKCEEAGIDAAQFKTSIETEILGSRLQHDEL